MRPGRQCTSLPAGPHASAEEVPVRGCVAVDGCGDGRMTTDDAWRVSDGEAVTVNPEPPSSHAAVSTGSVHTSRRGSTLVWYPLPAL